MTRELPIRIVGLGSPNGDDAVGWEVIRQLRDEFEPHADLRFHCCEGGHRLLELLDAKGTLFLIDALSSDHIAGTIVRMEWPCALEALSADTTHNLQLTDALRLAECLQLLPVRVVIFGIQAVTVQPCIGMSPAVIAAAAELTCQLKHELTDFLLPRNSHAVQEDAIS